jgi:dolichyl-phosphate-mannose-protein mannosyltransferase
MRASRLLAALLLGTYALLGALGAETDTPTVDEFAHLPSGCSILRHANFALYANNPPLARMLAAVPAVLGGASIPPAMSPGASGWEPWIYGQRFLVANRARYLHDFLLGRLVLLALATAGGALLYGWAELRHGCTAGVCALALYALDPNLQAHGRLATPDAACTTFLVATFFALDRWRRLPSHGRLALAGMAYGLALLSKFTALVALPPLALIFWGIAIERSVDERSLTRRAARQLGHAAARFTGFGLVALLVLNAGYAFQGTFSSLGSHVWTSHFCSAVAGLLPSGLPVPLPREFVAGFDAQKLVLERGEFGCYFGGRWWPRPPGAFYLAVLAFKLPLPAIGLLVWTAGAALISARWRGSILDEAFCWLAPGAVIASMSLFSALSGGIRYILPALPFLYLAASRCAAGLERSRWSGLRAVALGTCGLWLAATTVRAYPEPLAYFNALAGGSENGHHWLIDSNLDWGQDLGRVPRYLQEHGLKSVGLLYFGHVEPELYGLRYTLPPPQPAPGTYVVSVNFAMGYDYLAPDHGRMVRCVGGAPAWLRERSPDDRIGASLWVYHVP